VSDVRNLSNVAAVSLASGKRPCGSIISCITVIIKL
jgi:hypothetical protein